MNKILSLLENPAFLEASREELRVLVALLANEELSADEIALICNISHARASSAISYWREIGTLSHQGTPTITEEFEDKLRRGEIEEETSKKVAADIRDNELKNMIYECARLMNKAVLSSTEVKKLAALRTQYALSDEYILTLAAHFSAKGKLTIPRLVDEALKLIGKGIDSSEALEAHIKICESENGIIREFKNAFGIHDRNLSAKEKEYFKKWGKVYGYFTEIVGFAHDICVDNTGTRSFPYIDKVLTVWYESGCRTLSECRAKSEEVKFEFSAKKPKKSTSAKKPEEKARYGDFDVKDAFQRALERSYGKSDKK